MSQSALFDGTPDTLRTERLTLRSLEPGDLEALVGLLADKDVSQFTARVPFPYGRADAEAFLELTRTDFNHRAYAMAGMDNALLGVISLVDPKDGHPLQVGYWIGKPFWGQGYTSEGLDGLIAAIIGIGRIDRLGARVLVENPASRRVLEKNGFLVVEETTSIVERHRGKPLLIMQRTLR